MAASQAACTAVSQAASAASRAVSPEVSKAVNQEVNPAASAASGGDPRAVCLLKYLEAPLARGLKVQTNLGFVIARSEATWQSVLSSPQNGKRIRTGVADCHNQCAHWFRNDMDWNADTLSTV